MNITSRKGYALPMAMILIIILMISNFGLYSHVEHFTRETTLEQVKHTKGYYAAMAGLRYATFILRNPANYGLINEGDTWPVTGIELEGNFFDNIGVSSTDLTITITQRTDGKFDIEATYRY